jgi:small redox-active disulfide protein 2
VVGQDVSLFKESGVKTIMIYGPGCMKCQKAEEIVKQVVETSGVPVQVVKVSDVQAMVAAGIMSTPAVAVDGVVKLAGRIPKADEVREWIAA